MSARTRALRAAGATIAATFAAAAIALVGGPAAATPAPPYVLVAWQVGNPANVWETPQTLITSVLLDTPTLDALDDQIPCGVYAQVDLYLANQDSAALILGGVLYGPNNPTEPLAYSAVTGDPWKFVQAAPCAPKPEPRPWSTATETVTCESVTVRTAEGYFDLDFDPIANVWTERPEPTVVHEASSTRAPTAEELAEHCAPEEQLPTPEPTPELLEVRTLAATGVDDDRLVRVGIGALGLIGIGLVTAIIGGISSRRRGRETR